MKNILSTLTLCFIVFQTSFSQEAKTDSISRIKTDSLSKPSLMETPILNNLEAPEIISDLDLEPLSENFEVKSDAYPWKPNFETRFIPPRLTYFEDEFIRVNPFSFEFDNGFQGGWMGGINNHLPISDRLKMNVNLYASSSFYGPFYPDRYNNTTLSFDMRYLLHERIRLVAFGEVSLREGIDPVLSPMINGGYNLKTLEEIIEKIK